MPLSAPSQATSRLSHGLALGLWIATLAFPVAMVGAWAQGHRLDGLAVVMVMLTLLVAAIVTSFSRRYMRADRQARGYYLRVASLAGSVLVMVATHNVLLFALAWLASGALLAGLIQHGDGGVEAKSAARRARLTFAAGDAALCAALAIAGFWAHSLRVEAVGAGAATMPGLLAVLVALLMLTAAAARCALPPFSGWLLSSMTAPTPVSALMHAGLVNAGGVLLLRFAPIFEAAPLARIAAIGMGLVAAFYGLGTMLVRPDIKRSLAGSTVSQMGFMIMSCGLGAYSAALWHIVAHGLFKAWLFLGSGSAIGIQAGRRRQPGGDPTVPALAIATLGTGIALALAGQHHGNLVPLLLGGATACGTLIAGMAAHQPIRAKLRVAGLIVLLIGTHMLGLIAISAALGPDAPAILPAPGLIAILACFLGAWVWQSQAGEGALPAWLYVRLLNLGALHAPQAKMIAKGQGL